MHGVSGRWETKHRRYTLLFYIYQPRAAALAAKRKAVCFAAVTLLLIINLSYCRDCYLRSRSTDFRRFCVIRSVFGVLFRFHSHTDRDVKNRKFWAVLSRFHRPHADPNGRRSFQNCAILRNAETNLFCADDKVIMSWSLVQIAVPVSEIRPHVWGPKMCENGKWAIRKPIILKQLKIKPYNLRAKSSPM